MAETPKKRGRPFGTGKNQLAAKRAREYEAGRRASTAPTLNQGRGSVPTDPLTLSDDDEEETTTTQAPANDLETATIIVTLPKKYDIYPPGLRAKLSAMYRDALRLEFEEPSAYTPKVHYSVREGHFPRLTIDTEIDTLSQHGSHVVANMQLMDKFMAIDYPVIKGRGKKGAWIELETPTVVANPQFMLLHSIRHGDIGWGFDAHGCLSFHTVQIEGTDLVISGSFVQKMETVVSDSGVKEEPVDI
ncbi:hypothetical protein P154DRAFT_617668 [Amniculicola lignicola CBS 123094]|uniref:Uncharacterized protein n=1 Tax=Amniculicola lignicola CBS 123094 TaxID=1392246 RepID=A0A6A5WT62_9PLEO|nr:hypothetical protein P154DRAFT_617668 [Amniculicola lignicola CBS 123094]